MLKQNRFYWEQPCAPIFDSEGRIQPLNCKKGDIANRIISVGDPNRAAKLKKYFDEGTVKTIYSNMIYVIYTGEFNKVPISVIATGMGFAMIDLLVVQIRSIVDGPITIIRFGTCGSLSPDVSIGCYAVTDKVYGVTQSYENLNFPYHISKRPYKMDQKLMSSILSTFHEDLPEYKTVSGSTFSADTFYGSQGRIDDRFNNNNQDLIQKILETDDNVLNFEMEAYVFAFLAQNFPEAQLKVGAVCITLAERKNGLFLTNDEKYEMEEKAAKVLFKVISNE